MAQAGDFAPGSGINQRDGLGRQIRRKEGPIRGEGKLYGDGGAGRAGETPEQGSRLGIPTGEGAQVSTKEPDTIRMEPDCRFRKPGG